jgi:hypothetical protein
MLCLTLLLSGASTLLGQSTAPELEKISGRVESFMRQKKPAWKHETALPPTPPGMPPSPYVVIHFWSSENCYTAGLSIDGTDYGSQVVPCRVKLAIDQTPSLTETRTRLSDFVHNQRGASPTPLQIGDKGYLWNGSDVVFIKGKFTFWLSGVVDLRVGDFTINKEFTQKLAKDIAEALDAN